jgi:hypothetical protein
MLAQHEASDIQRMSGAAMAAQESNQISKT